MQRRVRAKMVGLFGALALVAAACSGPAEGGSNSATSGGAVDEPRVEEQGEPVPPATFEAFTGEKVSLADYAGRPVVINFWASWCPSCVAEMSAAFLPAQLRLGDQVDFLGMNIQDEREMAVELVEETGVLFDLAEDPDGALYTALGGLGMPFTVFVSADGFVLDVHNGPLTEDQLVDKISQLLLS